MLSDRRPSVMFIVTVSISLSFLRGHIKNLTMRQWRTGVVASPVQPQQFASFCEAEGTNAIPLSMEREISPFKDLISLVQLCISIRKFKPDIVNIGTPKAGLLAGLASAIVGVPIRIYTLHGLRLETATGLKRTILWFSEKVAMTCAHHVVCVGPSLRQRVHELKLAPPSKTRVLGAGSANGVQIPKPMDARESSNLRARLSIKEDQPVIGFVGRLTKDKGVIELVSAFHDIRDEFPDCILLLLGEFETGDPIPQDVRQVMENHSGIILTGFVKNVDAYYPLMNLLALPSYREGFPTVALEASAFGLPLVMSDATGARDAVQHGVTGWCVPVGDPDALKQALLDALRHPREAVKRGQAGRKWVMENFNHSVVHEYWLQFYEELLRRQGSGVKVKR